MNIFKSYPQNGGLFPYPKGYTFCGFLMLASEIWKQWTLTFVLNKGIYSWWHFPFQLCSIPMYVCLSIGLLSSARISRHLPAYLQARADRLCSLLAAFLMDFGLLGGIFVFFDTSGMHYEYLPLTIHSYAYSFNHPRMCRRIMRKNRPLLQKLWLLRLTISHMLCSRNCV